MPTYQHDGSALKVERFKALDASTLSFPSSESVIKRIAPTIDPLSYTSLRGRITTPAEVKDLFGTRPTNTIGEDEISLLDYSVLGAPNGVSATASGVMQSFITSSGGPETLQEVLDVHAVGSYVYVLYAYTDSGSGWHYLKIAQFDQFGALFNTGVVAYNATWNFQASSGTGASYDTYRKKTAKICSDAGDAGFLYVSFVQQVDAAYSPAFTGGANFDQGIITARHNKSDLLPDGTVPSLEMWVPSTAYLLGETWCVLGSAGKVHICATRYDTAAGNWEIFGMDFVVAFPLTIVTGVVKTSAAGDIIGIPQIHNMGGAISVSWSEFLNGGVTSDIKTITKAYPGTSEVVFVNQGAAAISGPTPYSMITDASLAFTSCLYMAVVSAGAQIQLRLKVGLMNGTGGGDVLALAIANTNGGNINGTLESCSDATFLFGTGYPADNAIYIHADGMYMNATPYTAIYARQPVNAIPNSQNYIPAWIANESNLCVGGMLIGASVDAYLAMSGKAGLLMDWKVGSSYLSAFRKAYALGLGSSDLEFGDVSLARGLDLYVWDHTNSRWYSGLDGRFISGSDGTTAINGSGVCAKLDPLNDVDSSGWPDILWVMCIARGIGQLRDPVYSNISHVTAYGDPDEETIVGTILKSPSLAIDPNFGVAFIKSEAYDEQELIVSSVPTSVVGTGTALVGTSANSMIAQGFFIDGPESVIATKARLMLSKSGSPVDTHVVKIVRMYSDTTTSVQQPRMMDIVAEKIIDPALVPAGPALFEVEFDEPIIMHPSTQYALMITRNHEEPRMHTVYIELDSPPALTPRFYVAEVAEVGGGLIKRHELSWTHADAIASIDGIARDTASGLYYVIGTTFLVSWTSWLGTIDVETGVVTRVADSDRFYDDICFDAASTLYGVSNNSSAVNINALHSISKTTAASTFRATLGYTSGVHAIGYDAIIGDLFHIGSNLTHFERIAIPGYAITPIAITGAIWPAHVANSMITRAGLSSFYLGGTKERKIITVLGVVSDVEPTIDIEYSPDGLELTPAPAAGDDAVNYLKWWHGSAPPDYSFPNNEFIYSAFAWNSVLSSYLEMYIYGTTNNDMSMEVTRDNGATWVDTDIEMFNEYISTYYLANERKQRMNKGLARLESSPAGSLMRARVKMKGNYNEFYSLALSWR